MLLVTLEIDFRVRAGGGYIDAVDRSRTPSRYVQRTLRVKGQIPDVSRLLLFGRSRAWGAGGGIEDQGGGGLIETGLPWLDAVDLACGNRGRVNRAVRAHPNCLHGEVFGRKELGGRACGSDLEHSGRRAGSEISVSLFVRSDVPDVGRRGQQDRSQLGPSLEISPAGDGNALGLSFFEFLVMGLRPEAGSLGLNGVWGKDQGQQTCGHNAKDHAEPSLLGCFCSLQMGVQPFTALRPSFSAHVHGCQHGHASRSRGTGCGKHHASPEGTAENSPG